MTAGKSASAHRRSLNRRVIMIPMALPRIIHPLVLWPLIRSVHRAPRENAVLFNYVLNRAADHDIGSLFSIATLSRENWRVTIRRIVRPCLCPMCTHLEVPRVTRTRTDRRKKLLKKTISHVYSGSSLEGFGIRAIAGSCQAMIRASFEIFWD